MMTSAPGSRPLPGTLMVPLTLPPALKDRLSKLALTDWSAWPEVRKMALTEPGNLNSLGVSLLRVTFS